VQSDGNFSQDNTPPRRPRTRNNRRNRSGNRNNNPNFNGNQNFNQNFNSNPNYNNYPTPNFNNRGYGSNNQSFPPNNNFNSNNKSYGAAVSQNFPNNTNQNFNQNYNNNQNYNSNNQNFNNTSQNYNQNYNNSNQNYNQFPAKTTRRRVPKSDQSPDNNGVPSRRTREPREKVLSTTTLYVTNLPFSITDDGLFDLFKDHNPKSAHIVFARNGRSRGYGFVEFNDEKAQLAALNAKNGHSVNDEGNEPRKMAVTVSHSAGKLVSDDNNNDSFTNTTTTNTTNFNNNQPINNFNNQPISNNNITTH